MPSEGTMPIFAHRMMIGALIYYTPVLIFFGTIGNFFSVCVLLRSEMKRSSSSYYLAALAISDTGFLVTVLIPYWLEIIGVHIFDRTDFCPFFIYVTTLWSFLSVWLVVSFTVERFVAVRFPLRRQTWCTVSRAKIIIFALTCLGPILCCPVLWLATPMDWISGVPACTSVEEWENLAFIFVICNTVVTFALPFTLIVLLNGLIVITIRKHAGVRRTLTNERATSRNDEKSSGQQSSSVSVSQTKITKLLLTVSSVFLCLNLPSYSMRVYAFCQDEELPQTLQLIQHIFDIVFDTSFGINFFLYYASGHNFRKEVLEMLFCCPRSWRPTKFRESQRSDRFYSSTKSTTSSGSCFTPQHSIALELTSDASNEMRDPSNINNPQKKIMIQKQSHFSPR